MGFLRVIELFPPVFSAGRRGPLRAGPTVEAWVKGAAAARASSDLFLVANLKKPELLKMSTLEASRLLQERLRAAACPVIVVRDLNRPEFLSSIITAISLGLNSVMVAWGDEYPKSAKATSVRDFPTLADAVHQASLLRRRAGASVRIFAPVDLDSLAYPKGVSLARGRLRAGADLLLAQPPTSDPGETFERHASLVSRAGLSERVLLNVFPFRNAKDLRACEKYFGWKLPRRLHQEASAGEGELEKSARMVVRRLRREGFPGVYLSTRGEPRVATRLLA